LIVGDDIAFMHEKIGDLRAFGVDIHHGFLLWHHEAGDADHVGKAGVLGFHHADSDAIVVRSFGGMERRDHGAAEQRGERDGAGQCAKGRRQPSWRYGNV